MTNRSIGEMETYIAELEARIDWAASQLHCLANEYCHRRNGADFAEIDDQDLQEVIDVLLDKKNENDK
jgi:hypothetical protein